MKKIYFLVLILLFFTSSAYAFYCGNEIVGRWDHAGDVVKKCGQPLKKGYTNENYNGNMQSVESWFYNCGETDFLYVLKFINNVVFKIETIQRGTGSSQCVEPKK